MNKYPTQPPSKTARTRIHTIVRRSLPAETWDATVNASDPWQNAGNFLDTLPKAPAANLAQWAIHRAFGKHHQLHR